MAVKKRKRLNILSPGGHSVKKNIFLTLASIVVFITTYALILPAITESTRTYCGAEEHAHSAECYTEERTLSCTTEETEGHTHTEACYELQEVFVCEMEESEEHTHTEECYETASVLKCGMDEAPAHVHNDDCYTVTKSMTCTAPVHQHTDLCYSDPNADKETEGQWRNTFASVALTGNPAEDAAAIARTQLGYQESTKNFILDENNEHKGYTRYGAWANEPYADWNTYFVNFCISYANVDMPKNAEQKYYAEARNLAKAFESAGLYYAARNGYEAKAGDLVFFDTESEGVDRTGIVVSAEENTLTVIEGDLENVVVEKKYDMNDTKIAGFVDMHKDETVVFEPVEETEETIEEEISEEELTEMMSMLAAPMNLDDEEGIAPYADATDMTNYVTGITISKDNGGKWQQDDKFQDGDRVRVDMSFEVPANTVTADNPSIAYTFPQGLLESGTTMNGNVYDHGSPVGTYVITTDSNGAATIVLTYNSDFADGSPFTGTAYFTAEVAVGGGQTEVEYDFAGTNTKITVTGKEAPYDIKINKSATLSNDAKSIDYVVDIRTKDGTDGSVIVTDALYQNWNGEEAGPAIYRGTVTVEKYGADGQKIQGADTTFQVSGNKFEKELPELKSGESYKLKYTVDVHDSYAADDGSFTIHNYANGKLKDHPYTNQGSYTDTEISKTKITKNGNYNQITGKMDFTITINNPKNLDLGNQEVVDVVTPDGITLQTHPVITDAAGNEISNGTYTEGDGKLFSYKFPSGATSSVYYIKYSTSAPAQEGETVKNTATYKGEGEKDYTASSNPAVHHRTFGLTKSTRSKWVDSNGIDKFEWQTYMILPDGSFPQNGYFYEDTIKDAVKGDQTFANTHYGTKSEIENKIHETFKINVIENNQEVEKDWDTAISQYVDVQIKCYTEKGGQEISDDSKEVKYFTVLVTPKNGQTFSATNMSYSYITSGRRTGFTDGKYYFENDGAVGNDHSTPKHDVDMGDINPKKTRVGNPVNDQKGTKVEWQASIDLPKSALPTAGYLFEDTLEDAVDSAGKAYPGTHYGTVSEIRDRIQEAFSITINNDQKNLSAAAGYVDVEMKFYKEVNGQRIETTSDDDPVSYFTVKITPKNGQSVNATNVTFKYYTRINENGINGGYFKYQNELKVGDKESSSSYSKRIMASIEKSVYTGNEGVFEYNPGYWTDLNTKYIFSSKDGTEVNYKDGIITYRIVVKTGKGKDADQKITLEDNLPEGMEFIEGSAHASAAWFWNMEQENFSTAQVSTEMSYVYTYGGLGEGIEQFDFNDHLHEDISADGRTLTLNLDAGYNSCSDYYGRYTNSDNGYIVFYYQARITDPAWNSLTTTKKTYVNKATWEQTGFDTSQETQVVRPIDDVSKFAKTEGHEVTKPGASEKVYVVDKINYDVVINPAGEDLNPDTHFLELVDTLNPGSGTAVMQLESIRLYAYSENADNHIGAPIDTNRYQYHYDADTKQLSMTIPDELACVLEYTYEVSAGASSHDYTISNKVSLLGKEYNSEEVEMKVQDSGATSEKSKITLYKVDKDNYGKHLAGVQFRLSYLENGSWIVHEHDPGDTDYSGEYGLLITDENGQIHFDNDPNSDFHVETLKQNTLYKLNEVSNPNAGYVADHSDYYFVWLNDKMTAETWFNTNNHENVAKDSIHFFEHEGASIYVENAYKNIAVKKVWVDEDGHDLINHPNNVTVDLYESTRELDVIELTLNFKSRDGSISKQQKLTMAGGSGLTITNYHQAVDTTVTIDSDPHVNTETTCTTNEGDWHGNITKFSSFAKDTVVTITVDTNNSYAFEWMEFKDYKNESEAGYKVSAGTVVDTVILNDSNDWSNMWGDDSSDYQLKIGNYYFVKETAIGGKAPNETDYTVLYQNNNGIRTGEILITNRIPKQEIQPVKTAITIEKKWTDPADHELSGDALEGKSAKFRLMQVVNDDVDAAVEVSAFTLPENDSWTKEFTGLNKTTYDSQGNATHYKYYFEEITGNSETTYQKESFWNFLPFVNGTEDAEKVLVDEGTVTVTNKLLPETTTVSVEKKWKDAQGNDTDAPASTEQVTVDLYKITDGQGEGEKVNSDPIVLSSANNWRYEAEDLIKKEYAEGVEHSYTYYFVEKAVDGYTTTYQSGMTTAVSDAEASAVGSGIITIINTKNSKTSVTVSKKWFKVRNGSTFEMTDQNGYVEFDLYRVKMFNGVPVTPGHVHTWNEGTVTVQPTETTEGEKTYTCTVCGETKIEMIGTLEHTHHYDNGTVTKEATCSSTGEKTYRCECGYSYTETIPVDSANHTGGTEIRNASQATETTDGYTGDTHCLGCGALISTGTTIPATGGSSNKVTVSVKSPWDGTIFCTNVVPAGADVAIYCLYELPKENDWIPSVSLELGADVTQMDQYYDDVNRIAVYTTVIHNASNSTYVVKCDVAHLLFKWSIEPITLDGLMVYAMDDDETPASAEPQIPAYAEKIGTRRISGPGWTYSEEFEADPGCTYTYYVVEKKYGNYTTTYTGQGTDSIIINNTITEESYELPTTGGSGTTLFTLGGRFLMLAACVIYFFNSRRRRERRSD